MLLDIRRLGTVQRRIHRCLRERLLNGEIETQPADSRLPIEKDL